VLKIFFRTGIDKSRERELNVDMESDEGVRGFLESVGEQLKVNVNKTVAPLEEDAYDRTATLAFDILEKYATNEVTSSDAIKAMRMIASHALTNHSVSGMTILYPSVLASATQIAVTERSKK